MRHVIGGLAAGLALFVTPAIAQSMPTCRNIALTAPAQGKNFTGTRPIFFSWSGEPVGTVSRELHLAALDGSETVIPLDGRFSDTVKVKMTGDLAWVVVFRDAAGKALCTTPAGLLTKGTAGGKAELGGESLSSAGGGAAVSIFMRGGRLVIVLQNSPYTGEYTRLIASDNYDGRNEDLMGAVGLEIHGNDARNRIYGSPGSDVIFAYGAGDYVDPAAGQDTIWLGAAPGNGNTDASYTRDGEPDVINFQSGAWFVSGSNSPTETNVPGVGVVGVDAVDTVNTVPAP